MHVIHARASEPESGNFSDVSGEITVTVDIGFVNWRLLIRQNNGDAAYTQLAKVELYEGAGHFDLTQGAAPTASSNFEVQSVGNLLNENYNDGGGGGPWTTNGDGLPCWCAFALTAKHMVNGIFLRPTTQSLPRVPKNFDVQYFDAGAWHTFWSVDAGSAGYAAREGRYFLNPDFVGSYGGSPHGAHAYWGLLCLLNDGNTFACVSKLELRGEPGGADLCVGGAAVSSSDYDFSHTKAMAFDGDQNSEWAPATAEWGLIGYHFPAPVSIAEAEIWAASGVVNQSPRRGSIQFSDDGAKWHSAFEVALAAWVTAKTEHHTVTDPLYL